MTLREKIRDKLEQLTSVPATIVVDTEAGHFESDIDQLEQLGCTFRRFQWSSDHLAGASRDRLQKLGDDLSARLNYLMEPIAPLEFDKEGFALQLRSDPPARDDDGSTYYEILARRDGLLSLHRYRKLAGQPRQPIAAQVTREVFLRLVRDFEEASVDAER